MPSPALWIQNLKFRYPGRAAAPGSSPWIIDIPRLELSRGEQVLLTGGSGSGKSTLLQLIAGLMDPTPSTPGAPPSQVVVDGMPIHKLHGARRDAVRGSRIGMIFQTFNLLHGFSAAENVMAALMFSKIPPSQHRTRAHQLLAKLGIERPDADPQALSVGQQQRVAVARALACDPALVLADEPTASLDPENAGVAMDLIQQLCREKNAALLCVSHDPSMAARFERRLALHDLRQATAPAPPTPAPEPLTA